MPFMTNELSKEIMTESRLKNNFLKNRTEENKIRYTSVSRDRINLIEKEEIVKSEKAEISISSF